jgi:mono/diheme cytochrome c family protein
MRSLHFLALATLAAAGVPAGAQPQPAMTRGKLLYTTHCIACHSTQMHWRDERRATDWNSLKAQVRRWQATAQLGWSESDIAEVARHLNDTIYRFPQTSDRVSRLERP